MTFCCSVIYIMDGEAKNKVNSSRNLVVRSHRSARNGEMADVLLLCLYPATFLYIGCTAAAAQYYIVVPFAKNSSAQPEITAGWKGLMIGRRRMSRAEQKLCCCLFNISTLRDSDCCSALYGDWLVLTPFFLNGNLL